ncbi:carnitine O-palmitoyltransferase 1, liver isoform-like isoform X1 [Sitodiplosis mosellana]|uniref:carnitine O-palmitoyltransferase 1, liver isoform-like isoform X1 n=2 Tax=Sitodiplosis mosellana TaxID=263140 RepID=UPI002443C6DF|nr:carnitine O-palmitoyltransferase 1, liver isoform-like isoform X1 [Sitodiplosis mosellana]XP_055301857.1 carnitine O-palmitoyltransferase 1, liver isoform-like isoform X1 [Sitodiplosis mosellana]XP_055301858.1 carnitine O-palmitoyltransferase 1, liver isoform-like isoform X1 [Sitodiplosis mosellana]XP_055301859.1 carnitine O-palmitoyltransferase 1, liver isoform-like isoform X1 [Sitodiplosis mosellana]XP_055301860.1 carnitine O-palmitoyltransferase 1, liver isoform-like isoform X1 [Sitodiplo
MAEAHQAVAFSFSISHEGWDINYDREVLNLVWRSGIRSWKKRIGRLRNSIHNGAYPVHLQSLWIIISIAAVLHFSGKETTFDLANQILPWLPGVSIAWHLVACSLTGLLFWLCICFIMRYTLKLLLMYKGWMYESREKGRQVSMQTRLWAAATKVLSSWNDPGLYSFQESLPRLPLPNVNDTLARYLDSVHPLVDEENYKRMEELAEDFERTIGPKLQRYLILKSWWSTNYVSDWWEEYVYLRGRSPLMVNSNFYGIDALFLTNTNVQTARAAVAVNLLLRFRRLIDRQELKPIMVQGIVPLCSWQYERTFNTVRIPGIETDRIIHYKDSNHIVVLHKGRYYRVTIHYKGRILKAAEIQMQLEEILNSKSEPLPGEELLASLTAWNRSKWAEVRNNLFNKGVNRVSLHTIETAAFILSLDDESYDTDIHKEGALDHFGKSLLHGNGHNRWFDKNFTLCVGTNGRLGFNAEHTWADAAIMAHIWENNIMDEVIEHPYDDDGNCKGQIVFQPPSPQRMSWDLNNDACLTAINTAHEDAQKLLNDLQLRIYAHDHYGKGFMKTCRVSPDAYIQMALQLAYYRDSGCFSLTYEASMTRLFREGRTETVRPCTIESAAWVKSMADGKFTTAQRVELLLKACQRHQKGYQDAMCGKGIDRHLFCLYVVSKYLEIESPFLKEVLSEPWRFSTSQTPHGQTSKMDLRKHPECISAGGGFGPVADDGYGVSYIIAGEDLIFFHISSKASCATTDAVKFSKEIERALADMKNLFEEYHYLKKSANGSSI